MPLASNIILHAADRLYVIDDTMLCLHCDALLLAAAAVVLVHGELLLSAGLGTQCQWRLHRVSSFTVTCV